MYYGEMFTPQLFYTNEFLGDIWMRTVDFIKDLEPGMFFWFQRKRKPIKAYHELSTVLIQIHHHVFLCLSFVRSVLEKVYNIEAKTPEALDPYSDDSKAPFYRQPAGIRKKKRSEEKEEAGEILLCEDLYRFDHYSLIIFSLFIV